MKKFNDIMQNYYDDPKLGIKSEEAPANVTGTAVAGTGDDSSTVVVKKKKNPCIAFVLAGFIAVHFCSQA